MNETYCIKKKQTNKDTYLCQHLNKDNMLPVFVSINYSTVTDLARFLG